MEVPIRRLSVLLSVLAASSMQLSHAHHAAAPHYNLDETITVSGTVTKLRLVNPHGFIYFEVQDETGSVEEWRCSLTSSSRMRSYGWTSDTLKPGQLVKITGSPARREDNHCLFKSAELEDGTVITKEITRNNSAASSPASSVSAQGPANATDGSTLDFSGTWRVKPLAGFPGALLNPGGDPKAAYKKEAATAPQLTETGAQAAESYDPIYDDPSLSCHPGNIISAWSADKMVNQIEQSSDTITVTYGYMDLVRTINLSAAEYLADTPASVGGYSIGKWEGDELVVNTIGFEPGILFRGAGRLHSSQLEVTERMSMSEDGQALLVSYVAHDPAFLETDWVGEVRLLRTDEPYVPYNCISLEGGNNLRP